MERNVQTMLGERDGSGVIEGEEGQGKKSQGRGMSGSVWKAMEHPLMRVVVVVTWWWWRW